MADLSTKFGYLKAEQAKKPEGEETKSEPKSMFSNYLITHIVSYSLPEFQPIQKDHSDILTDLMRG